jgi:hypothetical protein
MKAKKFFGVIVLVAMIGVAMTNCDNGTDDNGTGGNGTGGNGTGGNGTGGGGYSIGDTGPAGGIIFYVNAGGFTMTGIAGTCHYLEAAPANMATTLAWASSGFYETDISGTGTAIGTGKANTAAILAVDANAPAARACSEYSGGGKNDWFLPSKDELNELNKAKRKTGLPTEGIFWSSSQLYSFVDTDAWSQNFNYDSQYSTNKNSPRYVRAVRAF